jgi:hypothetical protein
MPTKTNFPVSSFGSDLQLILREAATREIRLECGSEPIATRLIHRFHAFRSAAKREKHPLWEEFYRCGIHKDLKDKKVIILNPRDSEFREIFRKVNISTPPSPDVVNVKVPQPGPDKPYDPVEDFLADLRGDKNK